MLIASILQMEVYELGRVVTSFSIREDLKRMAERAIEAGLFPGITTLSGLIEHALVVVFVLQHAEGMFLNLISEKTNQKLRILTTVWWDAIIARFIVL